MVSREILRQLVQLVTKREIPTYGWIVRERSFVKTIIIIIIILLNQSRSQGCAHQLIRPCRMSLREGEFMKEVGRGCL